MKINKKNYYNIFLIFLSFHLLIWTLIPSITNNNLPLDTIEALAWSSNLDWGFSKHPPASAFFVEIFYQIFGNQDWSYYLLSQVFVISSFFIVWKFSREIFKDKAHCLIAVLLLETIYFYNFTSPEFNVNVSQLPFWALTVFYSWKCFNHNNLKDWVLLGLFAALGFLSKYLFIYLLVAIEIFFIYFILANKRFSYKYLISGAIFILVLLPHLNWLVENDYITINYGLDRTGSADPVIVNHLIYPLIFFFKQIGILVLFFLSIFFITSRIKLKLNFKDKKLLFLIAINIIPITLMFLTSLFLGAKIRTMWMTPFYLFLGVLVVYVVQKQIDLKRIKRFIYIILASSIFSVSMYSYISIVNDNKRTDYPGKEIADLVQSRWDRNFSNNIAIVIGDEWHGGNLSYHLTSRPIWFNDSIPKDLNYDGGVIYTGNKKVLEKICPGIFGSIKNQGICMIGSK
ncbi:MAG: hypothetical protein CBC24_00165 [Candidatus Pelagibacter sp. TMED64]|nr:hypothetical protein [Candidatus Pelagibacter sp.]OUU67885.1 MAG: hypothetical protein CBC24_00165 [Candidatus Pelagibacter sp. TMED64]|tara:strand:+ start:6613 stop:7983 length:1371 start_codon:yes stop_codon:yes gene_type:complete